MSLDLFISVTHTNSYTSFFGFKLDFTNMAYSDTDSRLYRLNEAAKRAAEMKPHLEMQENTDDEDDKSSIASEEDEEDKPYKVVVK